MKASSVLVTGFETLTLREGGKFGTFTIWGIVS